MFVFRIKRKRLVILLTAVLLVVTAIIIFVNTDLTPVDDYAEVNSKSYSLKATNKNDRIGFFEKLGIKVTDEAVDEVTIPQQFNSVYESYNELQKKCGLNLSRYAGKTAKRYTYGTDDGKKAVILVFKNRIIGGHIASGVFGEDYLPLL